MRFVAIVAVLSFDYRQTTIRVIPFAWVDSISAWPSVLHAGKFGFDGDCLGQKTSASSLRLIKEVAWGIYGSGHSKPCPMHHNAAPSTLAGRSPTAAPVGLNYCSSGKVWQALRNRMRIGQPKAVQDAPHRPIACHHIQNKS
jgi:hypothetical protein